jgi:hypothetical protein
LYNFDANNRLVAASNTTPTTPSQTSAVAAAAAGVMMLNVFEENEKAHLSSVLMKGETQPPPSQRPANIKQPDKQQLDGPLASLKYKLLPKIKQAFRKFNNPDDDYQKYLNTALKYRKEIWANRMDFICSTLGYIVGLGAIWRL